MTGYPRGWSAKVRPKQECATAEEVKRGAWLERGLIMVRPEELENEYLRAGMMDYAIERWGRRDGR